MNETLTVLIVGGYGTFGGRLVELLEDEPRLTLVVAGRSLQKAAEYCAARKNAKAHLVPARFDRAADLPPQLSALKAAVVVDASGPFQNYGADGYRLVQACIALGCGYLDLADGVEFVDGIGAFDDAARSAGTWVLSGVSSFPVLTAAVTGRLAAGMAKITSITGGIAPSPYAGVGGNVLRAIAGYAGQKTALRRGGKEVTAWPLTETRRYTVAPPGHVPLKNTLFSLVAVPDLAVLPRLWPDAETVWMGAGPVPEILHRILILLSWLVRWRVLPSLLPLAGLMEFAMKHLRWGEDRGGMFVEVRGRDAAGAPLARSWHLLAEGRDGPFIPSMPAAAVIRSCLAGRSPPPGARTAVKDMTLDGYDELFSRRKIFTGFRDDGREGKPLYAEILGAAWDILPPEIRAMHDRAAGAAGTASVRRGTGVLAGLAGFIVGFPRPGENIPVEVSFKAGATRDGSALETWTRVFGGDSFSSLQYAGAVRNTRLLVEQFGPLRFAIALVLRGGRLCLVLRGWSLFKCPLPLWLAPRSDAFEHVENGRFNFNVEISHPLTGLIVHYQGWLRPGAGEARA